MNEPTLLLLFFALLIGGIGLLVIAPRLAKELPHVWVRLAGGSALLLALFMLVSGGPYLWVLHLEKKWTAANPKTRTELESHLALYTSRQISPKESEWGRDHSLQQDERMIRYSIIGQPLDVVFRSDDTIVMIYTSYE